MIRPFGRPVRPFLEQVIRRARRNLLVASPFISAEQAHWLLGLVRQDGTGATVRTLTSINEQSVASGALEIEALQELASASATSEVVNLPRLHAKVYVADAEVAIVTSANLTRGGLEGNYEYGVAIESHEIVFRIRKDMEAYARVGNRLSALELEKLRGIGDELRAASARLVKAHDGPSGRKFQTVLRQMRPPILEAQVGSRSANSIFSEAIRFVLRDGPLPTKDMHPRIQQLLPDLCDDRDELVINGQRFGKRWKHDVRNAQQSLKQAGVIAFRNNRWMLVAQKAETGT